MATSVSNSMYLLLESPKHLSPLPNCRPDDVDELDLCSDYLLACLEGSANVLSSIFSDVIFTLLSASLKF